MACLHESRISGIAINYTITHLVIFLILLIDTYFMTTIKYSKQNQETVARPHGSFVQDDLVHLRFEIFVGTSAEAYITYFNFNRCSINLVVRLSTNAFDIASPELVSSSR